MEKYYIIGAQQKNQLLKDWELYKRGLIIKVSPKNNSVEKSTEYISPPEVCPEINPSCSFTAGSIKNNYLYVGTQTEVLKYSLPEFKIKNMISLPCFNDIHHVRPTDDGNLLVVNTGLDMVMKLSETGKVLNVWNVLRGDPWAGFSREKDYRKIPTTKPHKSHPNYVFNIGNDIWVTRCLQKDAICLTKKKRINIGRQLVHDGVVFGGLVYFTQVDGHVVAADIHTLEVKHDYNLNDMTKSNEALGWCRGIKILNPHTVIVGFTRVRPTKIRKPDGTVSTQGGYGVLPTRIACYDLIKGKQLWEQNVEGIGMNAIYSIRNEKENDYM